ncbi:unnamed protein product [Cochlearia groenlandica]
MMIPRLCSQHSHWCSLNKNRFARCGVSETADKLANVSMWRNCVSKTLCVSVMGQQQQLKPPPMKAGWVGESRDKVP